MSAPKPETPTKTFGIREASDLLHKLHFDTQRLKAAQLSHEVRYAAFDCGLTSLHIADWVLHSVAPERCLALCGRRADERGAMRNFIERNADRLPLLSTCQQIANSSKHLVLTMLPDDPNIATRTTVRFEPPFEADRPDTWAQVKFYAAAAVIANGHQQEAPAFFEEVASDWHAFLDVEGLLTARPPDPYNIFS